MHSGSAWIEASKLVDLQFGHTLNNPGGMKATVVATTSDLQDIIKGGTPFRITNITSTNGLVEFDFLGQSTGETGAIAGSREVLTGYLNDPSADEKTAVRGGKPLLYEVSGVGLLVEVNTFKYETNTIFTTKTVKQVIETDAASIITTVGTTNITAGTIDTGPTVSVQVRNDKILESIIDLAIIGDGTTKFQYFVSATANAAHSSDFKPKIHYMSSANAVFSTTNAVDASGNVLVAGRALAESTELRSVQVFKERDRVRNSYQVQYTGLGSGEAATLTTECSDATSITNYKRKEEIVYAPWIQDVTTADLLCDTLLQTFKGDASGDGLIRVEAGLRLGQLFDGNFTAHLGDTVGIVLKNGRGINGKLLQYSYSLHDGELVSIVLGLPRVTGVEEQVYAVRSLRRSQNSMHVTTFVGDAKAATTNALTGNFIIDATLGANKTVTAGGGTSTTTLSLAGGAPSDGDQSWGYIIVVIVKPVTAFHDGMLNVRVRLTTSGGTSDVFQHTFGPMWGNASGSLPVHIRGIWPFEPILTGTITGGEVIFKNYHPTTDIELHSSSDIEVLRIPLPSTPLDHFHDL